MKQRMTLAEYKDLPKKGNRSQNLGRMKQGAMNRTETAYEQRLALMKHSGEILWYKFEAFNLRLANNTFYKPDFAVKTKDGALEFHEVKGSYLTDDGWMKLKIAAEMYPFTFLLCQRASKDADFVISKV